MSNMEQMEDNLSVMKNFNGLSEEERKTLDEAREALNKIPLIPCTSCNYCAKICPQDIGISGSFTAMNYLTLYKDKAAAKHQEDWLVSGSWTQTGVRVHQMWKMRGSLSTAHFHS